MLDGPAFFAQIEKRAQSLAEEPSVGDQPKKKSEEQEAED